MDKGSGAATDAALTVGSPLALHAASPAELKERREAERRATPFLLYRAGSETQLIFALSPDRDRVTVGRGHAVAQDVADVGEDDRDHVEPGQRRGLRERRQRPRGRRLGRSQRGPRGWLGDRRCGHRQRGAERARRGPARHRRRSAR